MPQGMSNVRSENTKRNLARGCVVPPVRRPRTMRKPGRLVGQPARAFAVSSWEALPGGGSFGRGAGTGPPGLRVLDIRVGPVLVLLPILAPPEGEAGLDLFHGVLCRTCRLRRPARTARGSCAVK